ncbi:MAG TPA: DUF2127 domain-containing protein [Polyangia bacterium]|nr:DUF2127 domain-containing protein [Polyangia bacterium]
MSKQRGAEADESGVRAIITYKVVKAILQTVAAAVLLYGAHHGLTASLTRFADHLRHHAVHAWSNIIVHLLERFLHAPHSIVWTAAAALADAALSSVEGYALWRGYAWGEWLVVGTTASLIPFEIYALTRHVRVGRVVLLILNLVIVTYLVNRARQRRAAIDAQLVSRTVVPGVGLRRSAEPVTSGGRADEPPR